MVLLRMRVALFLALPVLVASVLVGQRASAEVFDVPIPGVGRVETTIGFSPGFDNVHCTPVGQFSGNVSTPFFVYVTILRASDEGPAVSFSFVNRAISPSGQVFATPGNMSFSRGYQKGCLFREVTRLDEFGDYRYQFFFNGVEVARTTLNVVAR